MASLHTTHFFFLRLCTTTPQLNSILHRRHLSLIASPTRPTLPATSGYFPATSTNSTHTPTPLPRKTPTKTQPTGSEADEKLTALVDGLPTTSTLLCSSSEMLGRRDGTCPGLPGRQTDMENAVIGGKHTFIIIVIDKKMRESEIRTNSVLRPVINRRQ